MNGETLKIPTKTKVLILQHPQEPGVELGTVNLLSQLLENATLKIGLSWRNLSAALGNEVKPSQWMVLYLGSGVKGKLTQGKGLQFVNRRGEPVAKPEERLEGLVVLDGTWSQAKALWWRNAWLLKLKRAILIPSAPSLYGKYRKEPRRECVSTLEAVAETLDQLHEDPAVSRRLKEAFVQFLDRHRGGRQTGTLCGE